MLKAIEKIIQRGLGSKLRTQKSPLELLPEETILLIVSFLPIEDAARLCRTCRRINDVISGSSSLWSRALREPRYERSEIMRAMIENKMEAVTSSCQSNNISGAAMTSSCQSKIEFVMMENVARNFATGNFEKVKLESGYERFYTNELAVFGCTLANDPVLIEWDPVRKTFFQYSLSLRAMEHFRRPAWSMRATDYRSPGGLKGPFDWDQAALFKFSTDWFVLINGPRRIYSSFDLTDSCNTVYGLKVENRVLVMAWKQTFDPCNFWSHRKYGEALVQVGLSRSDSRQVLELNLVDYMTGAIIKTWKFDEPRLSLDRPSNISVVWGTAADDSSSKVPIKLNEREFYVLDCINETLIKLEERFTVMGTIEVTGDMAIAQYGAQVAAWDLKSGQVIRVYSMPSAGRLVEGLCHESDGILKILTLTGPNLVRLSDPCCSERYTLLQSADCTPHPLLHPEDPSALISLEFPWVFESETVKVGLVHGQFVRVFLDGGSHKVKLMAEVFSVKDCKGPPRRLKTFILDHLKDLGDHVQASELHCSIKPTHITVLHKSCLFIYDFTAALA